MTRDTDDRRTKRSTTDLPNPIDLSQRSRHFSKYKNRSWKPSDCITKSRSESYEYRHGGCTSYVETRKSVSPLLHPFSPRLSIRNDEVSRSMDSGNADGTMIWTCFIISNKFSRKRQLAFEIDVKRADDQGYPRTIGTEQRRKIMSINDKEYKRKCLQRIPAFTLTTSKCGCRCFVDGLSRGVSRRKNRDGGMCISCCECIIDAFIIPTSDEEHWKSSDVFVMLGPCLAYSSIPPQIPFCSCSHKALVNHLPPDRPEVKTRSMDVKR